MNGSQKRSHVATGNTPHKPVDKRSRNDSRDCNLESPVRRTVGFQERASPLQKVFIYLAFVSAVRYNKM